MQKSNKRKREAEGSDEAGTKKARSSDKDVRQEMLNQGALLLHFEVTWKDGQNASNALITEWEGVEKFGFFVTTDGCLIPAVCKRSGNKHKKPAYDVAMRYFHRKVPDRTPRKDGNGWPIDETISHLCHDNNCCAYPDLECVARWMDVKRNYCGRNGVCDCGMQPPCKRMYRPSDENRTYANSLKYSTPDLGNLVNQFFFCDDDERKVVVSIRPANYYDAEDQKRENRAKRIKREKVTKKQAVKKQTKLNQKKKAEITGDEIDFQ